MGINGLFPNATGAIQTDGPKREISSDPGHLHDQWNQLTKSDGSCVLRYVISIMRLCAEFPRRKAQLLDRLTLSGVLLLVPVMMAI